MNGDILVLDRPYKGGPVRMRVRINPNPDKDPDRGIMPVPMPLPPKMASGEDVRWKRRRKACVRELAEHVIQHFQDRFPDADLEIDENLLLQRLEKYVDSTSCACSTVVERLDVQECFGTRPYRCMT